jgi:hypothetical protein
MLTPNKDDVCVSDVSLLAKQYTMTIGTQV